MRRICLTLIAIRGTVPPKMRCELYILLSRPIVGVKIIFYYVKYFFDFTIYSFFISLDLTKPFLVYTLRGDVQRYNYVVLVLTNHRDWKSTFFCEYIRIYY